MDADQRRNTARLTVTKSPANIMATSTTPSVAQGAADSIRIATKLVYSLLFSGWVLFVLLDNILDEVMTVTRILTAVVSAMLVAVI
jgi:hypothetical protein